MKRRITAFRRDRCGSSIARTSTKKFTVFAASIVAMLSLVAAAGAGTITQAPAGPGYQNISPWGANGGTCRGGTGTYSLSGPPIRLAFGWGALQSQNLTQFFQGSHGNVSITGTGTTTDGFSDSWVSNNAGTPFRTDAGIQWTTNESQTLQRPDGTTVQGVSAWYRGVLSLAPGTYSLTVNLVTERPINDGFSTFKGTLSGTCTFTVVA
jgi:hypothetical protein